MESITRTLYGAALQTSELLGIPYTVLQNTTLNERFNINPVATLPDGQYPKAQYYCIGTGGVKLTAGPDNTPRAEQVQHKATDAACFKPFPFILREVNNDLSAVEKQKYALRTIEVHNGISYYAYYLKRIDMSQVSVKLESRNISNGLTTASLFTPSPPNLAPEPTVISNTSANNLTGDYVTCTAKLNVSLTEQDCQELLDASVAIFGNEESAIISEIGICTGVDKIVVLADTGTNFKEAVCVQIASHINTWHAIKYTQGGIDAIFDFGVSEPLFNIV
jgi:hypothetical protein